MRGTACNLFIFPSSARITPACAGNSIRPQGKLPAYEDHPRVCGEQDMIGALDSQLEGSPPRVRGTAQDVGNATHVAGITPACAGNRYCLRHLLP